MPSQTVTPVTLDKEVVLDVLAFFDAIQKLSRLSNGNSDTPMVSFLDAGYNALHDAAFGPVEGVDDYGDDPIVAETERRGDVLAAKYLEGLGLAEVSDA